MKIRQIKFFYKCIKFYSLVSIWECCFNLEKLIDKITEPMYGDQELEKFRNWYWTKAYISDIDIYDKYGN